MIWLDTFYSQHLNEMKINWGSEENKSTIDLTFEKGDFAQVRQLVPWEISRNVVFGSTVETEKM